MQTAEPDAADDAIFRTAAREELRGAGGIARHAVAEDVQGPEFGATDRVVAVAGPPEEACRHRDIAPGVGRFIKEDAQLRTALRRAQLAAGLEQRAGLRRIATRAESTQFHRAERCAGLAHPAIAGDGEVPARLGVIAQDVIARAESIAQPEAGSDVAVAAGRAELDDLVMVLAAGAKHQSREDEQGAESHRRPEDGGMRQTRGWYGRVPARVSRGGTA